MPTHRAVQQVCRITPALVLLLGASPGRAAEQPGVRRALIVVGLPGDREHAEQFANVVARCRDWLVASLGCDAADVRVLGQQGAEPATRDVIAREAAALRATASPSGRLWVFWLGHANLGDGHAYLHLDGPDLRDDEFAALFRGLPCREQVFWITSACGGWLVKDLSAPGRVVVAATERDQEVNETEFPAALADTLRRAAPELDADNNGQTTLLELYRATVQAVAARYQADNRVPTEHAQLDDNGDGVGTEAPDAKHAGADGALAATIVLAPRP